MKYFLKIFFIYLFLIVGLLHILMDANISDLIGNDLESDVEFVYEEF